MSKHLLILALILFTIPVAVGITEATSHSSHSASKLRGSVQAPCPVLAPGMPHFMGECIAQYFGVTQPTLVKTSGRSAGIDISLWQGYPDFPYAHSRGLRFVYNQVQDGFSEDSNFSSNVYNEHRAGLYYGGYLFIEGYVSGAAQAESFVNHLGSLRAGELPPALDAEVPGAYQQVCAAAQVIRARLHTPVVVYASPGLWPSYIGNCGTYLWTAIWGGFPYAFASWHNFIAQQYSGFGYTAGVSGKVDLDLNYGLLSLAKPLVKPKPTKKQLETELHGLYHYRTSLRSLLSQHHCRRGPPYYGHAKPKKYHTACGVWLKHGNFVNNQIKQLHKQGAY